MKILSLVLASVLVIVVSSFAQVSISTNGSQPDPSAGLDIKLINKGVLVPRMTMAQRDAISNPAEGLIVICTDCGAEAVNVWLGGSWKAISYFSCDPSAPEGGTHVIWPTQITWNWDPVSGATGYKWNTTNNYGTATDMGTATAKTETGLTCNTSYTRYVWANSACGKSSATTLVQTTEPCLVCGQPLIDNRDGKIYNTVLIDSQCWMVQNLNVGTRINGSVIQTNNSIIEKYCYGDLESNCDIYGGLYKWGEFMNYTSSSGSNPSGRQGICPAGWHIPSDAEWLQLDIYLVGIYSVAGGPMKETGTVHWLSPNAGATNTSGFTGYPGGTWDFYNALFRDLVLFGSFWTTTEDVYPYGGSWAYQLNYSSPDLFRMPWDDRDGLSGRCLQD